MVSSAFLCLGGDGRSGWGLGVTGGTIWIQAEVGGEGTPKLELPVWTCRRWS